MVFLFGSDLVWIAFGSQYALHLYEVNVERGIMIDLEITVKNSLIRKIQNKILSLNSIILVLFVWNV